MSYTEDAAMCLERSSSNNRVAVSQSSLHALCHHRQQLCRRLFETERAHTSKCSNRRGNGPELTLWPSTKAVPLRSC